jgi:hypothetical protein
VFVWSAGGWQACKSPALHTTPLILPTPFFVGAPPSSAPPNHHHDYGTIS